ncbi:MAG TPA: hypothetical protein VLN45_12855 [Ignavibacteriaceae bacterium]|nr:hypothetical protein [Ignavibacteriaceae bacterium]
MYKSLTVYLYQNSFYEDMVLELFEIEQKKKETFKKINTIKELKYLVGSEREEMLELLNKEMMILHDLIRANSTTAEEMGFIPDSFRDNEEDD